MANPRLLVAFTSALAVAVVAFAIAVVVGEWWVLPVALVGHVIGFGTVMAFIGARISDDRDKPDPVTEARLEEEAVEGQGPNGSRRPEDEPRVFGH
ncbi:MAG: hypothetical protein WD844_09595 [Thermoleophilaceae bacterium]